MSGDELRVTTAHVGDLAVKQGRAAFEIRAATFVADGADAAVSSTHGIIASATTSALEAVLAARRTAGTKMAAVADDLCDKLSSAARRYDQIDEATGDALDTQMPTGQR
jgi:hypothetical protein